MGVYVHTSGTVCRCGCVCINLLYIWYCVQMWVCMYKFAVHLVLCADVGVYV